MYMDDIKFLVKNEGVIGNPNTGSEDIGMEFGIENCAILIMKSGKRQMMEGTELTNQKKKNQKARKKGKLTSTW